MLVCHCWDWSACENRFGGSGTLAARNWAGVVGWISVPVLATMAMRLLSNRFCRPAQFGCRPYWFPSLVSGLMASRLFCASARLRRLAA